MINILKIFYTLILIFIFSCTGQIDEISYDNIPDTNNDVFDNYKSGEWTKLNPSGTIPERRGWHATVCDKNNKMVIYGGYNETTHTHDSQLLTINSPTDVIWSSFGTSGDLPTGRENAVAVYDPDNNRMILYGGGCSGSWYNTTYALDLSTGLWALLSPSGTAPTRGEAVAVYDQLNKRMILFGGRSSTSVFENTTHSLTLASVGSETWTQLSPSGTPPSPRYCHAGVYDPVMKRMIIFGGGQGTSPDNNVWALDLSTVGNESWTQLSPVGEKPSSRFAANQVAYDSLNNKMILAGGSVTSGLIEDLWALDLSTTNGKWKQLIFTGTQLITNYPSFKYDNVNNRFLYFGGFDSDGKSINDLYSLQITE